MTARISIVVALGRSGEHHNTIGKDNKLLWHIPDDLKRFKALTLGHPIIMGRKTFESIGHPLPERTNIVVTHNPDWRADGVHVRHSLKEAIEYAVSLDEKEIFIMGGSKVYAQAIDRVDKLYLTLIDDEKEADSFFPDYRADFTKKTFEDAREWNGLHYRWVDLERTT